MATADRVLEALRTHSSGWVSGEVIGREVGISRAAVHKHIQTLRRLGYAVTAWERRGYRLAVDPPDLDAHRLAARLNTRHLARTRYRFEPSLDSTQDAARREALAGAPHGTVIVADRQTRGRGRMERTWVSPPETGLYVSVLLRPDMALGQLPRLILVSAVAAAETVRRVTGLAAAIKWPNDILLNRRKIAGILTETAAQPDAIEYVIVGLGLNVNTRASQLPSDCRFPASSLFIESGKTWPRGVLLAGWLEQIEELWPLLQIPDPAPLQNRWNRLSATYGQSIRLDSQGELIEGVDHGIDEEGRLRLQDVHGKEFRILSGEVSHILPDARTNR